MELLVREEEVDLLASTPLLNIAREVEGKLLTREDEVELLAREEEVEHLAREADEARLRSHPQTHTTGWRPSMAHLILN